MLLSTLLLQLTVIAIIWIAAGRLAPPAWHGRITFPLKLWITVLVFWAILFHEQNGETIYSTLGTRFETLDVGALIAWSLLASVVRLSGIAAAITRWTLMLRGQGVVLPLRHVTGAFFIGRFLGTFLPSTLGLDGYKLYDASRFSGRTIEVSTATVVEKVLGVSGIFGTFLIALPFGISIFGKYEAILTAVGIPLALSPLVVIGLAFFWPGPALVHWLVARLPLPTLGRTLERVADAASAYSRRRGLLLGCWGLSLIVHFMTAATYYLTARALGVEVAEASFWQVTFASSIQILATVISPFTIAGEGVREVAQGLLLQNQMTFAVAAASATLGFVVAEAPTLLGAIPWFLRGERYRPAYCLVDGEQIDYAAARAASTDLSIESRTAAPDATPIDPLARRLRTGAFLGLAAGVYAGLLIGVGESIYLLLRGKIVEEAQVFWAAPLAYGALFGGLGTLGGGLLGLLPFPRRALERLVPPLGLVACAVPYALITTLFFLYRDVHAEQLPPARDIAIAVGVWSLVALALGLGAMLLQRIGLGVLLRARAALPIAALFILAAAGLGSAIGPRTPERSAPRGISPHLRETPNVLFIIIDTLRADALPAYGSTETATPALDRVAAEGTIFSAAFAQASWTKPSIASILTSLYPSSHRATHKPSQLPDSVDTVAEALFSFGYATAGIVTNINLAPSFNFQQGFQDYAYLAPDYLFGVSDSTSRLLLYEIARRVAGRAAGGIRPGQSYQPAPVVGAHAREWLDRHQSDRFFLMLHYMEPHDPYFTHPDDGAAIARATTPDPDPALAEEMLRRYRGEIEYLDGELAKLFADLERRGLWDELLIVVTSDHGEEFRDHGGWWHGLTLYDELIGVPLIVKWPKSRRGAPAKMRGQVRVIDTVPTLLAFIGAPTPPAMQGDDLLDGVDRDRVVWAEEDHEGNRLEAMRTRDWKLIRANPHNPRGLLPVELYRVSQDPDERKNLYTEQAARTKQMLDDLDALARIAAAHERSEQVTEIGTTECERLRALGYVESCEP